jgi:hypothetical protein
MAKLPSFNVDRTRTLPCPECGGTMVLMRAEKNFYVCDDPNCDCRHGAHPSGDPLGTPATDAVRQARKRAHAAFDPLWKSGTMRRNEAYFWLSQQLGIKRRDCHIGGFDVDMCDRVVAAVQARA